MTGSALPAPVLGVFSGYASIFNHPDAVGDVIMPGAFSASLASRPPKKVRLLRQHDPDRPAGIWLAIKEDAHGLWVKGALLLETLCGHESFTQLRARAMDGLSIGFHTKKAQTCRRTGRRILHAIDLVEISLVTFPMHPQARVQQVAANVPPPQSTSLADALRSAAYRISSPIPQPLGA